LKQHAATSIEQEPSPQYGGYAWFVVAVLSFASIVSYVDRQIINLLVEPIKLDFGINDTQIGLLQGFSFALFYALLALPLARLADSGNRRWIILLGAVCWSAATFGCGMAGSFLMLFFARMFVGVGEATLAPSGYSMLGDYFPKERVGLAISIFTGSGFIGAGLAYIIGGYLIAELNDLGTMTLPFIGERSPWQLAFMAVALPGILVVLLMLLVKEPLRQQSIGRVQSDNPSVRAVIAHIGNNRRLFVGVFFGLTLIAAGVFALNSWIPTYLIRVQGWSPAEAGSVFGSVVVLSSTSGVIGGGVIASWLMRRGLVAANLIVPIVAVLLAVPFMIAFPTVEDASRSVALMVPALCLSAVPFGCGTAVLPIISPNRIRAQVVAVYLLIANLLGFTLGPTSVGLLTDYVFKDPLLINRSLSVAPPLFCLLGVAILLLAIGPYRTLLSNDAN